ncbi:DUF4082 domain-containing protein [Dactylosporangium sp. NPDC051541]|uniref:DUF4082 domain-containing protein n=1 Tax=Dactylosporangium sp. NPDC051541 TaxID=3363977 RepID=UPI0037B951E4
MKIRALLLLVAGLFGAVPAVLIAGPASAAPVVTIRAGAGIDDDSGNPLQAHGSDVTKFGSTWYWYGSAPRDTNNALPFAAFGGINVYSSTDFVTWHYQGLAVSPTTSGTLSNKLVAYNPRVLYNAGTAKYVMVLSECCGDGTNGQLETGHLVFMTATTPAGPFTFVRDEWPPNASSVYDMGSFQDTDGTAYVLYSDGNSSVSIDRLATDYLSVAQRVANFSSGQCEEAPAVVKNNGTYFLTNSYCSGWAANQNHYRHATSLAGPWNSQPDGNLGNSVTYNTQAFDILPVQGTAGTTYVWIGDRWDCPQAKCDLSASTYAWLPLTFTGNTMALNWYNTWHLDLGAGTWTADSGANVLGPQIPGRINVTDGGAAYEMGMKFQAATNGQITAIRYYRGFSETGTHTGHLWTSGGTSLATVNFTGESHVGWQQATLSPPVTIQAGTVYVVTVGVHGYYNQTNNAFDSPLVNGPLTAVADGANGVYGPIGTFPTGSFGNSNYFADVSFTSTGGGTGGGTILTTQTPAGFLSDPGGYELGTRFSSTAAGSLTKVRIYTGASEGGNHTVRLWNAATGTVVAGPYTWNVTAGTQGWREFPLPAAYSLAAGTDYVVSVSTSGDNWYPYTAHGFDSPIVNGNLHTYTGSGVFSTTLGAMPTTSFNNTNYFRDVVVS